MAYNPQKTREWGLDTPNSGLFLNEEFNRIYENTDTLKDLIEGHDHTGGQGSQIKHSTLDHDDGTNPHGTTAHDVGTLTEQEIYNYVNNIVAPTGSVTIWTTDTPPSGWLECNGAQISRNTYSQLFSVIGSTYGDGDGSTTFNIPDFRGYFLRGWDHGAGLDPDSDSRSDRGDGSTGDNVGTKQLDAFQGHYHTTNYGSGIPFMNEYDHVGYGTAGHNTQGYRWTLYIQGAINGNFGSIRLATETRSKNVYTMFIIKY